MKWNKDTPQPFPPPPRHITAKSFNFGVWQQRDYIPHSYGIIENTIVALIRRESVKAFDSFVIVWNKFKETSDYQTCPENIKSTINRLVDDFKILEDEEEKLYRC